VTGPVLVGTRGWDHDCWSGAFYDPDLPRDWRFLHYTNQLRAVLVPWRTLSRATAEFIAQCRDDSDGGFRFVFEICQRNLVDGAETARIASLLDVLEARVAGLLFRDVGSSPASLGAALEALAAHWPLCVEGRWGRLADTVFGAAPPARLWRPRRTTAPGGRGRFLVALADVDDLRIMRGVVERLTAWSTAERSAALFFDNPTRAIHQAIQGRILAEILAGQGCAGRDSNT
jgi:hypothetical protein